MRTVWGYARLGRRWSHWLQTAVVKSAVLLETRVWRNSQEPPPPRNVAKRPSFSDDVGAERHHGTGPASRAVWRAKKAIVSRSRSGTGAVVALCKSLFLGARVVQGYLSHQEPPPPRDHRTGVTRS